MNAPISVASGCSRSAGYVLLTGATGLLGRYLMRDLLQRGVRLAVLIRPSQKCPPRERVESILQDWESETGQRLPRPVVLVGDICQPRLGLSEEQIDWVTEHCDQLIHSAAVLNFHGRDRSQDPWRTNLDGTQNVLELAQAVGIHHFHYVSTAYVCGRTQGPVMEAEFDRGQEFRNDYEASKFEAEQAVRAATEFQTTTVYRPAVIVGDSQSGYTSTYHGLFLYLRLMSMLVPQQERNADGAFHTPIRLPHDGQQPRNLVPVDWVSKAICHLVRTPEAWNRTYHLVPDRCTTAKEIIEHCYEYFNSHGVEFGTDQPRHAAENDFAQTLLEATEIYVEYETSDPTFDKTNLTRFAGHLACPTIDRDMVFRFLDFGNEDQWGKRRATPAVVKRWIESHLTEIALAAQKTMHALRLSSTSASLKMGLDIHGPGGGQWQLMVDDGHYHVTPGLPSEAVPILTLNDLQIDELLLSRQAAATAASAEKRRINWSGPLKSVMATDPESTSAND